MQFLDLFVGLFWLLLPTAKYRIGIVQQPFSPVLDLIGVNIELLGQFSQGVVALHGRQCHLRLEGR